MSGQVTSSRSAYNSATARANRVDKIAWDRLQSPRQVQRATADTSPNLPLPTGHQSWARRSVISDPKNVFAGCRETDQILDAMVRMKKPVVAMVNGGALGISASACGDILAALLA